MNSFTILASTVGEILLYLVPLILPIMLLALFWNYWKIYIRNNFFASQEYSLLRIKLPKTIDKTPQAMELFIMSLFQTGGEGTWIDRWWKGKTRPWFSLELVSDGGTIHFYIWTRKNNASYLESQIYAQYSSIEITRVDDYTEDINIGSGEIDLWGCEFALTEPDPLPIKTYIAYGLDKDQDVENRIDPMSQTLEFLSSIGSGNKVWIQIIARAHKKEDPKPGTWFDKTDKWKDDAKDEIKKIREEASVVDEEGKKTGMQLTDGQKEKIFAIEKSISKYPFDVGIRGLYIFEKDAFDASNIGGLTGSFKQYGDASLNGFKPTRTTSFDFPWQDISGSRLRKAKQKILEAYVERGYFYEPYKKPHFILNTEELATIFHFPASVTESASLERVDSRKGEPPANLPI